MLINGFLLNDANNTTPYPTPCHVRHSQNFGKIDSFLKPVLNIFIVGNIFVEWVRELFKRGLVFRIICKDLGEVLIVVGSRTHQSESWPYLGPSYIVEIFAEIVFGLKWLTVFVKTPS